MPSLLRLAGSAIALALLAVTIDARQEPTRAEGDAMAQKIAAITARAEAAQAAQPGPAAPLQTTFTERELNAYLKYNSQMPDGMKDAKVALPAATKFDGRATIDLDEMRKAKDYGFLASLILQGVVEIKLSGTFEASKGKGIVRVSSATLNGTTVPRSLLDLIVSHFSKSPTMPNGFELDKPFDMPNKIRELSLKPGSVTVVQ